MPINPTNQPTKQPTNLMHFSWLLEGPNFKKSISKSTLELIRTIRGEVPVT